MTANLSPYDLDAMQDDSIKKHCEKLNEQMKEWDEKLNRQRYQGKTGITIQYYWVTRIDGGDINEVPADVLINFADRWGYNFGGNVEYRGDRAFVQVYID